MSNLYILDGHTPKPIRSMRAWGRWYTEADRRVALTEIGTLRISTVFLGLDHNWSDQGPPLLFETMIFGFDESDSYQTRCATWDEAERQHALACDIAETLVRQADRSIARFAVLFSARSQG